MNYFSADEKRGGIIRPTFSIPNAVHDPVIPTATILMLHSLKLPAKQHTPSRMDI